MTIRSAKKPQLATACPSIELTDELGAGGNARVYAGLSKNNAPVAVKFMLNDDTRRYARFKDEVLVVTTTLRESEYVVPILEHQLPESPPKDNVFPWYSMPIANKFSVSMKGKPWGEKLVALAKLADGLVSIHALNVAHRDIKPDNLFEMNGTYRFGDFGLASFPQNNSITRSNEPMGPWAFMSPEMLSQATTADPFKADVYAFAKTVWCILTEKKVPFIGQYIAESDDGLDKFLGPERFFVEPLDSLLEESTRVSADQRPTAQQFAERLKALILLQDDYTNANPLQWEAATTVALQISGLTRAVWKGATEIAEVLTLMGRRHGMNHCFFPEGGGHTIIEAIVCEGGEMIFMRFPYMTPIIVRPVSLTLEKFPGYPALSYLVLETEDTDPLGAGKGFYSDKAEFLQKHNDYDYSVESKDDDSHNEINRKQCERRFKGGDFIIAPTTGFFNKIDDYMGTEGKAAQVHAQFEKYILKLESKKYSTSKPRLQRKVRLLKNPAIVNDGLELEYIDIDLLARLIAVDDALMDEQNEEEKDYIISHDSFPSLDRLLDSERTPAETDAWQLLRGCLQNLGSQAAEQQARPS